MTDNVNHPKHYTQGCVECIDALAAATINLKGLDAVCTAFSVGVMAVAIGLLRGWK